MFLKSINEIKIRFLMLLTVQLPILMERKKKVSLCLKGNFPYVFTIADVTKPIIGADFLAKFGLLVDIKNKKLIDTETPLSIRGTVKNYQTIFPKIFTTENKYSKLIQQFSQLLTPPDFSTTVKHNVKHHIVTNGRLPFTTPRRLDYNKFKIAKLNLNKWLNSVYVDLHLLTLLHHYIWCLKKIQTIGDLVATINNLT
uniref:Retrovirus-related Pol polyprotein n=1 Tax=Anoplophora glabripennis TaxID=217634 RepID=V5GXG5_ANOGL